MPVDSSHINPMILQKLRERDIDPALKNFLRDILLFERGKLDQESPRYTAEYKNTLNKYVDSNS